MATMIVSDSRYLSRKIKGLLSLTRMAKQRGLYFSSHDDLGKNVIAMDSTKKQLLYFKKAQKKPSCLIIDLRTVAECSVTKQYNSIQAGDLKLKKLTVFLKNIFLNFRFKNRPGIMSLPLYDAGKDGEDDLVRLEEKASNWQAMISKLLPVQILLSA